MTQKEFEKLNENAIVIRGFFGTRYLYFDKKTRIRFGFSSTEFGKTYKLQRKDIFWKSVAWAYSDGSDRDLYSIVKYLYWYEDMEKKSECLF